MKITDKMISDVMREIGRSSWSRAGKVSAAKLTPEQKRARALHAVRAREAQRAAKKRGIVE